MNRNYPYKKAESPKVEFAIMSSGDRL